MMQLSPIALALIAMLLVAASKTLFRWLLKQHSDPWPAMMCTYIGSLPVLLLLFGVPVLPDALELYALLGAGGLVWALAILYDVRSHIYLDVAVSAIFGALRYVLLAIAGWWLFDEQVSPAGMVGMGLIVLSVLWNVDLSSAHFRIGSLYRLVAILLVNVGTLNDKFLLQFVSANTVVFAAFFIPALTFVLLRPRKLFAIPAEVRRSRGFLLLAPLIQPLAYYFYALAYAQGKLVVATSMLQLVPVVTLILGVVLLGERAHLSRRLTGSIVCVLGAWLVAAFDG